MGSEEPPVPRPPEGAGPRCHGPARSLGCRPDGCRAPLRAKGTWAWGAPKRQDGLVGVVQLGVERVGLRSRHFRRPSVGDIAPPVDLDVHHCRLWELAHQLGAHLWELLQGIQRDGDALVADGPEAHCLFAVMHRGHRHLHHWRWAIGQEGICGQEGAHLSEHPAPFLLVRRLVQAQPSQERTVAGLGALQVPGLGG